MCGYKLNANALSSSSSGTRLESNGRVAKIFSIMFECNKLPLKAKVKTTHTRTQSGKRDIQDIRYTIYRGVQGPDVRTLIYFCCHFASAPHSKCAAGREIKQIQMTKPRRSPAVLEYPGIS